MAKNEKQEHPVLKIKGMSISNVRRFSDSVVAFTLSGNGLGLYGLKVVEGQKGPFISSPQQKGKDGKYYNIYSVYFAEDDEKKIIQKVLETAPKAETKGSDL